jgi:hypothetical protein
MKPNMTEINPANILRAILWGFGQALSLVFVCGIAVAAVALLQRWEDSSDGFLDKVALLLLFITAALISMVVVLARPAYLVLKQRLTEGVLLILATISWLALMTGFILIVIKAFDVHSIF